MTDRFGAFLPGLTDATRRALEELRRRITANSDAIAAIPQIQFGEASGTTDGSGIFSVTFPTAFATTPTVIPVARTTLDRFVTLGSSSTTGFSVTYFDLSAGAPVASDAVIVNWVAIL